jgi:hypothetical protein
MKVTCWCRHDLLSMQTELQAVKQLSVLAPIHTTVMLFCGGPCSAQRSEDRRSSRTVNSAIRYRY